MSKLFIFDFDGTICDSFRCSIEVLNGLSDKFDFKKVEEQEIPNLRNLGSREILDHLGISLLKLPFVVRSARMQISKRIMQLKSFRGMSEVLKSLHNTQMTTAIVTSNSEKNVKVFLREHSMQINYLHCGTAIFGKARALKQLIKKLNGTDSQQIYYIGDEVRDIQAAQEVGIRSVAVTWGYNSAERLRQSHPDYVVEKPEDLLELA